MNWPKLKMIRYTKEDLDAFFVKEGLEDEFKQISVTLAKQRSKAKTNALMAPTSPLYCTPQAIKKVKYQDLMSIVVDLPEDRRQFYENLNPSMQDQQDSCDSEVESITED